LHPIRVEDLVTAVSETVRNVRAAAAVLSFDPLRQVGSVRGVRPAAGAAASGSPSMRARGEFVGVLTGAAGRARAVRADVALVLLVSSRGGNAVG
jgi:hypothetical protein